MDYEFRRLTFEDGDVSLQKVVDLQNIVYSRKHTFTTGGFRRWYIDNPMGRVISYNAFWGEELVAHYACVPYKMKIKGRVALGLLDIATVTHPSHRGKGLFKKLAQMTYEYAKDHDFEFVLGVANANSFPGYMKYFPFTYLGQLQVKVGLGTSINIDEEKEFCVYWDEDSLRWRSHCCRANYSAKNGHLLGRYNSFVHTYMGTFDQNLLEKSNIKNKQWKFRPILYVGLGAKFGSLYLPIPRFVKHSPFNLIFLDLTDGGLPQVTRNNIFVQLFDFDVI